jgi:hypothetical protein
MGKVKVEIPVNEVITTETFTKEQWDGGSAGQRAAELRKKYVSKGYENVKVTRKIVPSSPNSSGTTITIDNPLKGAPSKAAFALKTQPKPQYYLQFGYLLQYVRDNILLKVKVGDNHDDNPPVFDIDFDQWSNHMYSLPNQISLDPRVCVVRNDRFNNGKTDDFTKIFSNLYTFKEIDNGSSQNDNAAYVMNVYLNFNFIIECLKTDERGDVNVFEFIKSICDGINKALGGINNLEPIIEETSNTLKIIDTTPIPGYSGIDGTKKYTLQLYGYNKLGTSYISNFIRKVDLKTAITPEFATMITVGATAGGYVKGVEATAFSRWNYGLTDRFKEEFTPGNQASITSAGSLDEAEVNYVNKFLLNNGYVTRYGFPSFSGADFKLSDDIIEGNISVGTEYFKYIVAKSKSSSGGTIGFIPFKISFTMDGLSGIKIYNKLNVDTRFLPRAYGNNLDLIVTGVSHKLSNSDWETDIEATVIPKTKLGSSGAITSQIIQQSIEEVKSAPGKPLKGKISSCREIPSGGSSKNIIKASDNTDAKAIGYVINKLEGGYFHPLHAWDSKGNFKPSFDYRSPKGSGISPGNSGETLWGIDRPNGGHEKNPNSIIKNAGIKFWNEIDTLSGFGIYKNQNQSVKKYNWDPKKYPKPQGTWNWLYNPGFKAGTVLADNAQIIIKQGFETDMRKYFGSHPLANIIRNDGRLLFMYYRAWWNGPGWFQKFSNNLKNIYNSGTTDIDKLICADLTYRYNIYSADFWKKGIAKMKDLIDFNKSI